MARNTTWIAALVISAITAAAGCAERGRCLGDDSLCMVLRIQGTAFNGELGFRFDSPRDLDGDSFADIAAGARFTQLLEKSGVGTASAWSGIDGSELNYWEGDEQDALFGHAVISLVGPSDAYVVSAAPLGTANGHPAGRLLARSAKTNELVWTVDGRDRENLGWAMALAGDHNDDGFEDFFAGAPAIGTLGRAYLIDGASGVPLREYESGLTDDDFGSYVSALLDVDGDGKTELIVSSTNQRNDEHRDVAVGGVTVFGSASGDVLLSWSGEKPGGQFGRVVAGLSDVNGDTLPDVAISAPGWDVLDGDVFIYSGADGSLIHKFSTPVIGENYGRMVAFAGDADGDGVGDVAIGAPWHAEQGMANVGRIEIRSGDTGDVLFDLTGDGEEAWFGWHMARANQVGDGTETGLLVSSVRSQENGLVGAGALELFVYAK